MFINNALAQATTEAAPQSNGLVSLVPMVLIFVVFYFLIIRPQSKKMKEHRELVNNLKIGNKVITSGGIVGVVKDVLTKEEQVMVEIADGVRIKVMKNHVAEVIKSNVVEVIK
jgi:preprotein translocase subunit YajC